MPIVLSSCHYYVYVECSGGISVVFSGQHLNVTSQPQLVVFIGSDSYYSSVSLYYLCIDVSYMVCPF